MGLRLSIRLPEVERPSAFLLDVDEGILAGSGRGLVSGVVEGGDLGQGGRLGLVGTAVPHVARSPAPYSFEDARRCLTSSGYSEGSSSSSVRTPGWS